ncbi:isoprenoid synthase domain-containing protein [Bisporella sp. PMI_857]|nr:isoprenoid synthase domain-containing protein [Bisporella sp. PMI_857]
MYNIRVASRLRKIIAVQDFLKQGYVTTPYSGPAPHTPQITDSDVVAARAYCSNLLQKFDSPSFTLQTFIPSTTRDAYLAIRALNVELARIPDLVSNPTEPVAILLHYALQLLQSRHPGHSTSVMKGWFIKIINARENYMDNRPYTSMEALELYAENTYSTLMYLTLAALPLHSMAADHVASHIGKAAGIITVLRGLPLIAFPPPPNHHSINATSGGNLGGGRQGAVLLPLDIMAETGVKEEDVLRQGAEAPGLKDAIFTVATRANDHLITAREMLKNLQQGKDAGHAFEHEGEEGHQYAETKGSTQVGLDRAFGKKLERHDFDIFKPELRAREWKLPWKAYWAYSRRSI